MFFHCSLCPRAAKCSAMRAPDELSAGAEAIFDGSLFFSDEIHGLARFVSGLALELALCRFLCAYSTLEACLAVSRLHRDWKGVDEKAARGPGDGALSVPITEPRRLRSPRWSSFPFRKALSRTLPLSFSLYPPAPRLLYNLCSSPSRAIEEESQGCEACPRFGFFLFLFSARSMRRKNANSTSTSSNKKTQLQPTVAQEAHAAP